MNCHLGKVPKLTRMKNATVTGFPLISKLALDPLNQLGPSSLQNLCPHKGLVPVRMLKVRTFPDLVEAIRGNCRFCRRAIVDHLSPSWYGPERQYEHDTEAEGAADFAVKEAGDNYGSPGEDLDRLGLVGRAWEGQDEQHC